MKKIALLFVMIISGNLHSETMGNRVCLFRSAELIPDKCFRKLSDCEIYLEESYKLNTLNKQICKVR
jgi:hypothetical protein